MSREIKFRGWNTKTQTMLDLKAITPLAMQSNLECDGVFLPFTEEVILMQYTGLKDKNGVEIYEGDIVAASIYGDEKPQVLPVDYRRSGFVIDYEDSESECVLVGEFVGNLEIIGNVHQDPKLLENE